MSLKRAFRSDGFLVATRVAIETRSIRYRDSSNLNMSVVFVKDPRRLEESTRPVRLA